MNPIQAIHLFLHLRQAVGFCQRKQQLNKIYWKSQFINWRLFVYLQFASYDTLKPVFPRLNIFQKGIGEKF